jgi:uncharacterized spore protein YtfJ
MVTDLESEIESAFEDADDAAGDLGGALAEKLARRLGASAKAGAVFGDPVERDGVTVIPVAKIKYGFGAGGGGGTDDDGEASGFGSGGGGGLGATPVGYIEIRESRAEFVPIRNPAEIWPLIVAGGVATWLIFRGLRALFR